MAISRLGKQIKRPYGFCVKITAVAVLGLCFLFVLSTFSPSSSSLTSQRSSFSDIAEPVASTQRSKQGKVEPHFREKDNTGGGSGVGNHKKKKDEVASPQREQVNHQVALAANATQEQEEEQRDNLGKEKQGENELDEEKEETVDLDQDGDTNVDVEVDAEQDKDLNGLDEQGQEQEKSEDESKAKGRAKKYPGPVFDLKTHYSWKMCSVRSKHNYIPCIDFESSTGKLQLYRHHERSCPKTPPMCLVPLPSKGYQSPVKWPQSKLKILYENVKHPKLSSFAKTKTWIAQSGEYLSFPQNQSEFKGGVNHYIDSIEEMVPDIEWGKNIRLILDVGCTDSSFGGALLDKEVLTLSLGLKDDLVDLALVALERGFAAIVSPFRARRLPFPSGAFEMIHCGGCSIPWHSNGGKLLLEMNRILRPGGYFILSTKHDNIEQEEAMSTLMASICWNILAHKTDEISEMGVKIYQKPESNDIYELRRRKTPPLCKEDENPDATWYVSIKSCLHIIPSSIEQRGTEWPEEWPQRLQTYPEWLSNRENLIADTEHWKSIVEKSYLVGMGINWSNVRNIMDMKAIYGGFAAALVPHNVWVMNVVPIHAPDTLPVIFERGLVGIYHDWCESFGTYPRTYDLLHADHLFSRLKNRCKQPVGIVVEMDRILRPGGWAIIRDKVEILDPLEVILRSLHWEIQMTYAKDKQGIICAQKTSWRP